VESKFFSLLFFLFELVRSHSAHVFVLSEPYVRLYRNLEDKKPDSQNAQQSSSSVVLLKGHEGIVNLVEFDPLGEYLASVGSDGSLKIWSLKEERLKVC